MVLFGNLFMSVKAHHVGCYKRMIYGFTYQPDILAANWLGINNITTETCTNPILI